MANFIGMVFATLQKEGVDTKGMSTDEAVKKFNELKGKNGGGKESGDKKAPSQDKKELTPNERKRLQQLGVEKENDIKTESKKEYEKSGKGIKQELKDNGIDTKNISVRERSGGYSNAYYITIKDPSIDKDKVEKIAKRQESYERDMRTGEILEGGNTYVFVNYDDAAFDEVSKPYEKKASEYLEQARNIEDGYSIRIKDGVWLSKDGNSLEMIVQNDKQHARRRIDNDPTYLSKKLYQIEKFGKMM